MVNVVINGLQMRFTMATMMLIAEQNPNGEMLFPLSGLDSNQHGIYILYGALAAYDEKQERAPRYSLDDCKKLIKDFTGKQYIAMYEQYNKLITIEPDEQDISKPTEEPEPEKPKKK